MPNNLINQAGDRAHTYKGILQIETGPDTFQLVFIQDFEVTVDDTDTDRDLIDTGSPVFTAVGDVKGPFRFNTKDTIDLYDSVNPAVDTETVSYWKQQINARKFPVITLIETLKAEESTGNKFGRDKFTGRIMSVKRGRSRNQGVPEVEVIGEVTNHTSALRSAS